MLASWWEGLVVGKTGSCSGGQSLAHVWRHISCVWLFVTLWTVALQTPLSVEFYRQEYWSGLPFPSPGDLPNPRIKPTSLKSCALVGEFFTTSATWEALLSKALIQLSADGKDYTPSLVVFWPETTQPFSLWSLSGWWWSPREFLPRGTFPDWCPHPCGEPLPTPNSTGDPPALASSFGSVSLGSLLLSSESWCMQGFVCILQVWVFLQSCGSLTIKSLWLWRSDSLGIPSPFVRSPGWEAWCGVQNLHKSERTSLVLLFSSLRVIQLVGMGFDFIMSVPLLPSCCVFFFLFGCAVSSFGRFQHPPVDSCSTASCDFGALAGGHELMFVYSAILNQKPLTVSVLVLFLERGHNRGLSSNTTIYTTISFFFLNEDWPLMVAYFACPTISPVPHYCIVSVFHCLSQFLFHFIF